MQLDMLRRRSAGGSMTILGDIAQSTGPWARDDWEFVEEELAGSAPLAHAELEYGYRVPEPVFAFASQLLPYVAPGIVPPVIVRPGTAPRLVPVTEDDRVATVVAEAREGAGRGRSVGVVIAPNRFDEIASGFDAADVRYTDGRTTKVSHASIVLLDAVAAKGLEFDAVVVVEPEEIVASDLRGHRLLYVALTRCTTHLSVVHVGSAMPLPEAPAEGSGPTSLFPALTDRPEQPDLGLIVRPADVVGQGSPTPVAPRPASRLTDALARTIADDIKATVDPSRWGEVLAALSAELSAGESGEDQ